MSPDEGALAADLRGLAGAELLEARGHVGAQLVEAHGPVAAGVDADVARQGEVVGLVLGGQPAPAEVAQDPKGVALSDAGVDGAEQGGVVPADGLLADAPPPARVGPGQGGLLLAEEGALAVLEDVGVAEVQVGGEPDFHGRSLMSLTRCLSGGETRQGPEGFEQGKPWA